MMAARPILTSRRFTYLHAPKRMATMATRASSRSGAKTLIKICGVNNPEDAQLAAQAGADFIGMIMWPKAKRSVSDEVARQIADVAKQHGVQPVGVFVDEEPQTITNRCRSAGIGIAQLHGDGARSSMPGIPDDLQVIYVMHATPSGEIQTPLPPVESGGSSQTRQPDWILLDGLQGGSGQALDWTQLQPPQGCSKNGWLLAGGLKPENVATAVKLAQPVVVDVSSGVCGPDGLKKDPAKIVDFVAGVKSVA